MPTNKTMIAKNRFADHTAIAAILVVLDMLSAQLADIAKDVETSVVGVCTGFHGMSQRAKDALGTASDALNLQADGQGLDAFVQRIKISLEILLRRIESSTDFSAQLARDIDEIDDRMELLLSFSDRLNGLASDAKRVAASTPDRSAQAKDEYIYELREQVSILSHATIGSGGAIKGLVNGLKKTISNTSNRVREKSNKDLEAAAHSECTVRDILDQLTDSYAKMRSSLTKAASMSRQLNMDISQAVMSMQFQDRVNQRIQHLLETINELAGELQPYTSDAHEGNVQSITEFWMQRVSERTTMAAERKHIQSTGTESDEGSIELF
ncbi:MAG: hypothetical protein U0930_08795 [Pirellulales bacterium]